MDFDQIFLIYILPALVVAGIAGILAFLLAFLGQKMAVQRDPRIDDVARNLSGANCGGCGYAGCDAFAEALVKGEADISACNATPKENKQNIARILDIKVEDGEKTVAVVHCNGGNKCKNKFDYQGYGNCLSAQLLAGGNKACEVGCMGLGSCMDACPYDAINVDENTAVATVDKDLCRSCGICISACPKKLISRIPYKAVVYVACSNLCKGKEVMGVCANGCIGCGKCAKNCPSNAISLTNNLACIDYTKCVGCGNCVELCPRHCILYFHEGVGGGHEE